MEETQLEAIPAFAPGKKKINKRFIYLVLAVLVIILVGFLYKMFGQSSKININQKPAIVTQTPKETKAPTATPTLAPSTKSLDKSKLSITIENGSGEAGVAGKGSDFLKGLGYDVSSTGNADNYDYTGVTIKVKASNSDYLSLLKKDLSQGYTVSAATSDLDDSFSSDALVIIGK
jgi:hypothetical protein